MTDLILRDDFQKSCPTIVQGLKRAQTIFDSIKSFEDIERFFLKGNGLSEHTYRSYLTAIKQFYEFTNHLNPLQVMPAHIESFYDDLVKKVDRNTAYKRIQGLKKFFKGIRGVIPIYTSPFEIMPEKLLKKLSRKKKGNRTKAALSKNEANSLLDYLSENKTVLGLENHALIYMLITSGLRSFELCQLRWKNIEYFEGSITAFFTGKGGTEAEQELYGPAVEACREYFKKAFHRQPKPDDFLFYTVPSYNGEEMRSLKPSALWDRVKKAGGSARDAGIIKRDINITPHTFRRSYATILSKSGMGLKAIQIKTRHANIETLAKYYIDDSEPAGPYLQKILA